VDTVEKVGEVVMYVAKKVVEVVEKVVDFICALFEWGDILETHDVLAEIIDKSFNLFDTEIGKVQQKTNSIINQARSDVASMMSDARKAFGVPEIQEEEKDDDSDAMDMLIWFFDKIMSIGGGAADLVNKGKKELMKKVNFDPDPIGIKIKIPESLQKELKEAGSIIPDLLKNIAKEGIEAAVDSIQSIDNRLKGIISEPEKAPQYLIGLFLDIGEIFIDTGLAIAAELADAMFKLVRSLLKLLKVIMDYKIEIPFITDLYSFITGGRDLTIKSIGSLLLAIPVTIIGKLTMGVNNFDSRVLSQDFKPEHSRLQGYGICHIILGLTETIRDMISSGRDDEPNYNSSLFLFERGMSLTFGSFMAFISYIPTIAAIVISGPYTKLSTASFIGWFMQIVEFGLDLISEIGEWVINTKKKVGKGFRKVMGILNIFAGVIHLIANGIALGEEYEAEGEPGKHLLATGYVTTTLPAILGGILNFPKIPGVIVGLIIAGKAIFQFTEGGVTIALANVRADK
jgi:hypothetical protein